MIGEDAAILEPDERLNEEAMYTIYSEGDINRYEDDEIDEYVDLNEALETIRQIREDEPELYRRISELRDGIRCGYQAEQEGTMVYCKSGEYQQLYLVDGQGEIITREIPYILNLLKCDPGTPAQPLPEGYNQIVMNIKEQFEAEVKARNAEQEHTRNLTRAQRYILKQIQILYRETDNQEIKKQLHTLSEAFNQYIPIPALRAAINRIRRDGLTGEAFLDELTQIYHLHRMDEYAWDDRRLGSSKGNDTLPRIVCSEGLTDLF
jgi:hypothetical protein